MTMRKTYLALGLVVGLGVLAMFGCGSNSSTSTPTSTPAGNGSLVLMGTDAPLCNVYSFTVTISGITLTPQGGGSPVSILGAGQTMTVDFLRLMDFNTVLKLASVPVGTYSQMTLTLTSAQLTVIDVTQTPPGPIPITTSLQNATVTINLDPALDITKDGTASLLVDFHLFRSVMTMNNQVTGEVNPVMTVSRMSPTTQDGLGRLDDLHGIVQSVSTTSSNSAFIGSFTLQRGAGFGPVLTINVTSNTEFEGAPALSLSNLAQGSFVEVYAKVDTSGNIVAREVEVEGLVEGQGRAAFEGIVIWVDLPGQTSQFVMFVREEHPDVSSSIPLRSPLTVNLSGATNFKILRPAINQASLTFGPTNIGVGQTVIAYGNFQTGTPNTLAADGVALRPQTVRGTFGQLLGPAPAGTLVGGFNMVPCAPLFKGQAITVFTFADTEFYGVSDLSGLNNQTPVHARGLLFYEPGTTTINGITVTPPSMVMEANRVGQRPAGD